MRLVYVTTLISIQIEANHRSSSNYPILTTKRKCVRQTIGKNANNEHLLSLESLIVQLLALACARGEISEHECTYADPQRRQTQNNNE